MTDNQNTIYIADPDYCLRKIAGEYLLIPTGKLSMSRSVITISETAALLWPGMKEGIPLDRLADMLLNEYEVDRETALADVKDMVDNMCELSVISARPADRR